MKKLMFLCLFCMLALASCGNKTNTAETTPTTMSSIASTELQKAIDAVKEANPGADAAAIEKGVTNAAKFWTAADGTAEEFTEFCVKAYLAAPVKRHELFEVMQRNLEVLYGHYNRISIELKMPTHSTNMNLTDADEDFGMLDPFAHFFDDMFASKIAFRILLNFPPFTLEEKNTLGENWTREEWAYARMGDLFNARVPAEITQLIADKTTAADNYIADYNIVMGNLRNTKGEKLFPDGMQLITHWGLRDELKSDYADAEHGLEKQRMIYQVMTRIIDQSIPEKVINSTDLLWCPETNEVTDAQGNKVDAPAEPDTRYQMLYEIYLAEKAADPYSPTYPTYLQRAFDQQMEVSDKEIEEMFVQLVSSPVVKEVGQIIAQRLGRKLEPFDIWYDGFKSRSSINEDDLTAITQRLYPTAEAFQKGTPEILRKLGFTPERAQWISSMVQVDPSRGAGHAWQAMMKGDKAHLRTRIGEKGMDYKGYNIATHEFGHNVEQTISLNNVDNYMMVGVPSTAFTEALAFVFQTRDLQLLGINGGDSKSDFTLDIFWGCYEIMGVALVDLYTWRWLYANPNATMQEMKQVIIANAKDVWNKYYAPVLGEENSTILAIYSHMFSIPLYLPNYPYGHLVQYQLEEFFEGKNLGAEVERIYPNGRLTPNHWMRQAVGSAVSVDPILRATEAAVKDVKSNQEK